MIFLKIQKRLRYLILSFLFFIVLLILLLIFHLEQVKTNKAFNDLNRKSDYELILKPSNNCHKKRLLYTADNYEMYGICTKDIYIKYKGREKNLSKLLKEKTLTLNDLVYKANLLIDNGNIRTYQINKITISINYAYKNYIEVVFYDSTK